MKRGRNIKIIDEKIKGLGLIGRDSLKKKLWERGKGSTKSNIIIKRIIL